MTERDKETGRYRHAWGFIHFDEKSGVEWASCQDCPAIHRYGGGLPNKVFKNLDAAHRAGLPQEIG